MGEGKGGGVVGRLKEEWRWFKGTILEVREEVCGTKKIRKGKRRKGMNITLI